MTLTDLSAPPLAESDDARVMAAGNSLLVSVAAGGTKLRAVRDEFGVVARMRLRLIGAVMPLRASSREEAQGMDVVQHGEEAYVTGEGAILVVPEDGGQVGVPVADPG